MQHAHVEIIRFHEAKPAHKAEVEGLLKRLTTLASLRDAGQAFEPDELLILAHELDLNIVGDRSFFDYEKRLPRKPGEPVLKVKLIKDKVHDIVFRCAAKYAHLLRKDALLSSPGDTLFNPRLLQAAEAALRSDGKRDLLEDGEEPKRKTRERVGDYTSMPNPFFNWFWRRTTAELATAAGDRNRKKVYAELKRLWTSGEIEPELDAAGNIPKTIKGAMWGPEVGLLNLKKLLSDWLEPDAAKLYAESLYRLYQKPVFLDDTRNRMKVELCQWIHPDRRQ